MSDILTRILTTKQQEVAAAQAALPLAELRARAADMPTPRGFVQAMHAQHSQGRAALIAEIKKASPSKGLIRPDFHPEQLARAYEAAGAACLSVLTDEPYFQGSAGYLKTARAAVSLPVLRKDFMVNAYQIYQSRAMGADAVLLIAAALSQTQLEEFEGIAHELGMAVLLELHHADELEKCRRLTTPLRGVNNRNLRTFEVSLQQTLDLLPEITGEGRIVITESGIRSREDVQFMRSHGVHSFLIGETFMRADDVGAEVKKLFA
ncbi:indole-3-glycerol phosphate synthase TrpC [Eikenella corrodens]|uniref:indole-3-glycerol phosphate synthase TrpC n=1 Tax=Eikenella corrodens TaxID=539 RepID=UPI00129A7EB7|nr:indole-3-glycerol phosphate synthase TrpC [Eikenella corrodens]